MTSAVSNVNGTRKFSMSERVERGIPVIYSNCRRDKCFLVRISLSSTFIEPLYKNNLNVSLEEYGHFLDKQSSEVIRSISI